MRQHQERLAVVFEDFKTTKRRGLGLGLAICRKIVEQLDGTISVTSEVGEGTTFRIRLPISGSGENNVKFNKATHDNNTDGRSYKEITGH